MLREAKEQRHVPCLPRIQCRKCTERVHIEMVDSLAYDGFMTAKQSEDQFDDKEAQARFEAALRGALKTPPTPLKEKPKKRETSKLAPRSRSRSRQKINKDR
jgi:hypothetical protein